mmetsp:Transcript_12320/g.22226  ORF Transcript_12320/g.22226 Transcript_12320/m.22226 type:complete len:625 (-) Transcript_12320:380-2254(-)
MPSYQTDSGIRVVESDTTPLLGAGKSGYHDSIEKGPTSSTRREEDTTSASSPSSQPSTIKSTAALAFAMLTQSFLLVGVFPYSGFLAMHLVPSLDEDSAGRFAGLIASSFMVGRTFTSFLWGRAADKYGRTFSIEASLLLSAVFSVLFGLAPTLPLALLSRFALGLSNGLIGSIKTIITEMSHGDKSKETRTMAIVMGMWGYGFLVNPAFSGYLADPMKQYPNSNFVLFLDSSLNLTDNPFLLPNLAGCVFCLSAYFCVRAFVEETLPQNKIQPFKVLVPSCCRRAAPAIVRTVSSFGLFKHLHLTQPEMEANEGEEKRCSDGSTLPRWVSPSPSTTALTILSARSSAAMAKQTPTAGVEGCPEEEKEAATIKSLWARPSTRKHLSLYWVYSFLIITVDETFPLYCISKRSGLGVEEKVIGNLLSGAGSFYILIGYFLLTGLVDRFGFYKSMVIGSLFSIPTVSLIPLSLLTNRDVAEGSLAWSTLVLVSLIYAITRACSSVCFSTLTMTTNRTVPAHQRAAMNGLSMLGGSLGKAAGPAFAGLLFSESVERIVPPMGSVVVWIIIAFMGLGFFVQTLLLPEHENVVHDEGTDVREAGTGTTVGMIAEGNASTTDGSEDKPPSF